MKADHYYSEMLKLMRAQGAKDNPITLQLGIVQSGGKIKIGDLILNPDDYYLAKHLKAGYRLTYQSGEYVTSIELIDNELKAGDLVAIQQLNDTDRYVVLERVVEA
jgi:hypothetical protein